jgi:DNA polymerase-1
MVIGEAPGATEDEAGEPFVGRMGTMIREELIKAGIDLSKVYFTHAVSCRPPDNKTPSAAQLRECRHWVQERIKAVKPKYVLLLGNTPLESLLHIKGIKKARGNPVELDGIIYLPTYSPGYILHDDRAKAPFEADLRLFKRLIDGGGMPEEEGLNITVVDSRAKLEEMLRALRGDVSYDIETNSLYPWDVPGTGEEKKKIVSVQFGTKRGQFILLMDHPASPWSKRQLVEIIHQIDDRLKRCYIVTHNGKFDALWMLVHYGVRWFPDFDTMLAHYLLDENAQHSLKVLPQVFLGAMPFDIDVETKRTGDDLEAFLKYGAKDAYYTLELKKIFYPMLYKDTALLRVFEEILMPCVALFVEAEYHGVFIDTKRLDEVEQYLKEKIDEAQEKLDRYSSKVAWDTKDKTFVEKSDVPAGERIGDKRGRYQYLNWGSSQQLSTFLYYHLGLPIIEKTAGGSPSTSESVLLRTDHEIAKALLDYRAAQKQLTAFVDGWRRFLVNGRLHPSFKLHGTVTGRLSCENPNLQQVPRDKKIRTLITAPPGWTLIEADLSQIEMRIAAELSGDKALLHAYRTGIDVHWLTAIREIGRSGAMKEEVIRTVKHFTGETMKYGDAIEALLKIGPKRCEGASEELGINWKEVRKKAKAINFGYLYGMWWKKFRLYARDNYGVDITDEQAQDSRIAYFELYADLPQWHNRQRRRARLEGFVRSLSGRKRRLPAAMRNDKSPDAQAAERQAINSPVQSFANEINLMAAIQLRREFGPDVLHIVGTVHDAILFEVRDDMVEVVYKRILEVMAQPALFEKFRIHLGVPIEAEASIGPWGAGVSLDKWKEAQRRRGRTFPRMPMIPRNKTRYRRQLREAGLR